MNAKGLRRAQDGSKREWERKHHVNKSGTKAPPTLVDVGLGRVTRVSTDRTQSIPAAALGFRPVDPFHCHLDQERNRGQRANRDERNGGGLPNRPADPIRHEHSDSQANGRASEREQTIEWNLLRGFWNGYRERHRIPLYVSF